MSSEVESSRCDDEDFGCGLLLRDIEEISKALYVHKSPHEAFNASYNHRRDVVAKTGISESKSDVITHDPLHKEKKSSIWKWRPLKALTHIRGHRFNCCFFLHVHTIEGLPPNFNNLDLRITWKRKTDMLQTRPAHVSLGIAEFEETLMHRCTVYVSRTGPRSSAKYEPKLFLLQASVVGAPTLDIGSRWIDVSRLLPLTLEELEGGKSSPGKWTTSFNLTGKAKGATVNVSFGFSILSGNSFQPGYFVKVPDVVRERELNHFADFDITSRSSQLHNLDSVPGMSAGGSYQPSVNSNFLEEIFPKKGSELPLSVALLYQKFDEGKMGNAMVSDLCHEHPESLKPMLDPIPECSGGITGNHFDDSEFHVNDQGIKVSIKDQIEPEKCSSLRFDNIVIETIDVAEIFAGEEAAFDEYAAWDSELDSDNHDEPECGGGGIDGAEIFTGEEVAFDEYAEWESKLDTYNHDEPECATDDLPEHRDNVACIIEPAFEGLDSELYDLLTSEPAEMDSLLGTSTYSDQGKYMKSRSGNQAQMLMDSLSLDDVVVADLIENDFLNMLGIDLSQDDMDSDSDHDLPSDLLRLFEEDSSALENPILDSDVMAEQKESSCFTPTGFRKVAFADDFDLSLSAQSVQSLRNKRNAEVLENLETEALMHEWGLSERAFQYSPRVYSGGFGSPVYTPVEEPLRLPSIDEGLGPIVQTKDGGFLRSMNPLLFKNANNGARLIMQVSAPVVLPSAMGFTIMEMLQLWASVGVDKMCIQANELMPLEDVTGKTIHQVLADAESASDAFNRLPLERESDAGIESIVDKKLVDALHSCLSSEHIDSDYVSLKDLVPMALTNIEGLLVEGLKIQSGMPDLEAPSSIRIQLSGNSVSHEKSVELPRNFCSERASCLQVLDVDELIKYSVSLEEWVRLDSSEREDNNHENDSKLFTTHFANPVESSGAQLTKEDERVILLGRKGGIFSNNFTMGLKVQLRDPLRNHEMVGSPMLALVQVDRVYSVKQPELHHLSFEEMCNQQEVPNGHIIQEGVDFEQNKKKIIQPMFKVSEAHLTGPNVIRGNKSLWGTSRQQQSGSRWLLSSGMTKPNKNNISKFNAVVKSSSGFMRKALPEDVLWSIAFPTCGEAGTWNDQIALNVHIRNPDIIFPTDSVK
ncbi:hypothetical protein ACS0TY_022036 [Phlomoides rotata]